MRGVIRAEFAAKPVAHNATPVPNAPAAAVQIMAISTTKANHSNVLADNPPSDPDGREGRCYQYIYKMPRFPVRS